jgi:hypothetical protein
MTEDVGNERSVASRFTRSVNIQQDLWQPESLQGYLVTAGARRALLRIAPARYTPEAARAWTLTGPYGTGKSALANFTAKLLASDLVPGHAAAWKLLRSSDSDLAQHVRPPRKTSPPLLPIVITGSREPLQIAILRGLQVAMTHLHSRRCSHLLGRINESLAQAASGKQPSAHAITELFAEALKAACSTDEVGGFFLVLDELGKLLEYAAAHPANSDLYLLGSIGEALYAQGQGKRWAEIETVLARLPQATALDIGLVKTIGLLCAMGQWRNLLATDKILRFALHDTPLNDIRLALRGLKSKRAVIHRRYNHSFGLWEGSDIDLDQRIRAARGRVDPSKGTAALAAQFVTPRPFVAKRHSFTTGSLRYFEVRFVGPSEFVGVIEQPRTTGDGQISFRQGRPLGVSVVRRPDLPAGYLPNHRFSVFTRRFPRCRARRASHEDGGLRGQTLLYGGHW